MKSYEWNSYFVSSAIPAVQEQEEVIHDQEVEADAPYKLMQIEMVYIFKFKCFYFQIKCANDMIDYLAWMCKKSKLMPTFRINKYNLK